MRKKDERKSKPIKGSVKNKAREFINAPDLKTKSETERPNGKNQERAGKARRKAGKTTYKAGKIIPGKR
jgi:uncharacterized protein YjbJ (UPF0337 family)